MKTPAAHEPVPVETVTAGPDEEWIAVRTAATAARVGTRRILAAIAADELVSRPRGRARLVRRADVDAWAPRPIHLTDAERLAEVSRVASLRREGLKISEIAQTMQRSTSTVMAYLDDAGVSRTMGPTSKHPQPEPRQCARPDCDTVFTPEAWRVAKGEGLFCSEKCRRAAFLEKFSIVAVYEEPKPRLCGSCGVVFTPRRANAGRGHGKFCSKACSALDRWRRVGGGNLDNLVTRGPLFRGAARGRWLGGWHGGAAARAVGRVAGKARAWSDEQAADVCELREKGLSRPAIQRMRGWTVQQIRDMEDFVAAVQEGG